MEKSYEIFRPSVSVVMMNGAKNIFETRDIRINTLRKDHCKWFCVNYDLDQESTFFLSSIFLEKQNFLVIMSKKCGFESRTVKIKVAKSVDFNS